jgi:hypothetical protein
MRENRGGAESKNERERAVELRETEEEAERAASPASTAGFKGACQNSGSGNPIPVPQDAAPDRPAAG